MIPVSEALARVLAAAELLPPELVALEQAFGRVLAEDVTARLTQPPTDVSAMDGYAVRGADLVTIPTTLKVVGAVPAGGSYDKALMAGEAVRIFTGAGLPRGADTVVIQENTRAAAQQVAIEVATATGRNVRLAGLDFKAGALGLTAGRRLSARDIGLAAAMNRPWLPVRRRPRVAVLATGDEIVMPGDPVGPHQIVSSNALALTSFLRGEGAEALNLGIAPDKPEALQTLAARAKGVDLLLTTGGASVGEHDLVRGALADVGLSLDFWKIAMRPGKPLIFGKFGNTPLLGLPGNPVSTFVCALLFVRPFLRALQGLPQQDEAVPARLAHDLGANDQRQDYLRSRLWRDDDGVLWVEPFKRQDSSMMGLMAEADGLLIRLPEAPALSEGDQVMVLPFAGSAFNP